VGAEERQTLSGNASLARSATGIPHRLMSQELIFSKRESSATIKAPPIPYEQKSPPTRQKIIEFDCRGLEFTEFKPEVSYALQERKLTLLTAWFFREIGLQLALILEANSLRLISRKANGLIMMRKLERKLVSRT
jgi:hypothetical protein